MYSLREVLDKVSKREISPVEAEKLLKMLAIDEIGCFAKLDGNRELRKGIPEIVLAEGKTASDIAEISSKMLAKNGRVIVSRCSKEQVQAIKETFSNDVLLEVNDKARMVVAKQKNFVVKPTGGKIGILTAGTSDIPVAEEAKIIAQADGLHGFLNLRCWRCWNSQVD